MFHDLKSATFLPLLLRLAVFVFFCATIFDLHKIVIQSFDAERFSRAKSDADAVRNWVSELCCAPFALSRCSLPTHGSLLSFASKGNNAPFVARTPSSVLVNVV